MEDSLKALLELQESREEAALADGYKAFTAGVQKQKASDLYSSTPAALGLVSTGISAVHGRIVEWLQEQGANDRNAARSGRKQNQKRKQQLKHFAAKWFNMIGPDVVAYMGLKVVLDTILKRAKYTKVCLTIAERIIDELRYRKLKEQAAAQGRSIRELILLGVRVTLIEGKRPRTKRVKFPLITSDGPKVDLTNEQIYEHIEFP